MAAAISGSAAGRPALPNLPMPKPPLDSLQRDGKSKLGSTPLYFEPNVGQSDAKVQFLARGGGFLTLLTGQEAFFFSASLKQPLHLTLAGARKAQRAQALEQVPGLSNYFYGKDPAGWRTNVPHYAKVRFEGVYKGIDVVFYSGERRLEYDFVVAPGADPNLIELAWEGVEGVRIDEAGDMVLSTTAGDIRQRRPKVYQEIDGRQVTVEARYRKGRNQNYQFELASWDRKRPLVIDPQIVYSTYLGGAQGDEIYGITTDAVGSAFLTGYTKSANFPVANAYQSTNQGNNDIFVTKLALNGTQLFYSTYIGGEGDDLGFGITIDSTGSPIVVGRTSSFGYPVTQRAFQKDYTGGDDAVITKLVPDGNRLSWSTYLGTGEANDSAKAVGVDYADNVIVTGTTNSSIFITTPNAYSRSYKGNRDLFVSKFDSGGINLLFSTYIGGVFDDDPNVMVIDRAGDILIGGGSMSPDYPATPGTYDTTPNGLTDGFVSKLSGDGKKLLISTMIGSASHDAVFDLALEAGGRIVVSGQAGGADFPTTQNAYDRTWNGGADAFAARFNSGLSVLIACTLLGTSGFELSSGVKVGSGGYLVVAGYTDSVNFPATPDAFQFSGNSSGDVFLSVFEPLANANRFSTILGGAASEVPRAFAQDLNGDVYVAGVTASSNYPAASGFDITYNGNGDGFLTKVGDLGLSECVSAVTPTNTAYPSTPGGGGIGIGQGCPWFSFTSVPWVTLTSPPLSSGPGSMNYTVSANSGSEPRTGAIYAAGNLVQLVQKGTNTTAPYDDVPVNDQFVDFIRIIKSHNVTSGCTASAYCPNDNTTRGQMAVFIVRSMLGGDDFTFPADPYFSDVPIGHPQFKWIQKLREMGITTGCNLIAFCPADPVTRSQMAAFLIRSKFGNNFPYPPTPYFTDVASNNLFFSYVQKMRQMGITLGCGSGTQYCGTDTTTRGQMAVFLSRIFFTPW
ncbi:MAG TPA: SBBP repeat-containing protein [Bryobacteraceae bacterium]|nr:SBBP repeat-containing protein [Bryobacteraceae bacterium]